MRTRGILGIVVLCLVALTACTPADEPIVALAVRAGRPVGVLVACPGQFSGVSVYRSGPERGRSSGPHVSWSVSGRPVTEVVEVPLLGEPPAGWQVDPTRDLSASEAGIAVDNEPLTELVPGERYSLSGSSRYHAIPVRFSSADYDRIGPDEVLVADGRDSVVVSRQDFLRGADDKCD